MAAGQGFKTFATGDVLSASDVNGYLMQGVLVFADATERNAEITSPQEGQFAYLKDTNVTTYYTGSAWANLDTTGMTNPMTTTGDTIYSSSGSTPARLGIGSTGQVLTVSGGVPTWATAAGSSGPAFRAFRNADQTVTGSTSTKIQFDQETFDTDACFDPTTNYRFTPNKAGYYEVTCQILFQGAGTFGEVKIFKNGSATSGHRDAGQEGVGYAAVSDLISMNGTTDYLEGYCYIADGAGTEKVLGYSDATFFNAVWIRSN